MFLDFLSQLIVDECVECEQDQEESVVAHRAGTCDYDDKTNFGTGHERVEKCFIKARTVEWPLRLDCGRFYFVGQHEHIREHEPKSFRKEKELL